MRYLILLALLVAVAISGCDSQNDNGILVSVHGTVTQEPEGTPVEGVGIEISLLFDSAPSEHIFTDAQGEYVFEKLISRESCTLEFSYAHPRDNVIETRSVPCVEGEQVIDVSFPAPVPTFAMLSAEVRFDFHSPVDVFVHLDFRLHVGDFVTARDIFLDGDVTGVGFNDWHVRIPYGDPAIFDVVDYDDTSFLYYSSGFFSITEADVLAGGVSFDGGMLGLGE